MARRSGLRLELGRSVKNASPIYRISKWTDWSSVDEDSVYDYHPFPINFRMRRLSRSAPTGLAPEHNDEQPEAESSRSTTSVTLPPETGILLSLDGSHLKPDWKGDDFHVFMLLATMLIASLLHGSNSDQTLCQRPLHNSRSTNANWIRI